MKPVLKLNNKYNINVSKKKTLAFIELNLACDIVLECIYSINLPNKIKKSVNDTLIPFLDTTMYLVANDADFKESNVLSVINEVCSNYIKSRIDVQEIILPIALQYLYNVMNEYKMDSGTFRIMDRNGDLKTVPGSLEIRRLLKFTLIPFYQNQIDKVFNNSPMSEAQFRLLMSREIQTRIKTALDLAKIKK